VLTWGNYPGLRGYYQLLCIPGAEKVHAGQAA